MTNVIKLVHTIPHEHTAVTAKRNTTEDTVNVLTEQNVWMKSMLILFGSILTRSVNSTQQCCICMHPVSASATLFAPLLQCLNPSYPFYKYFRAAEHSCAPKIKTYFEGLH